MAADEIDGEVYKITGTEIDVHGSGMCGAAVDANVSGRIEGDTYVMESIELE